MGYGVRGYGAEVYGARVGTWPAALLMLAVLPAVSLAVTYEGSDGVAAQVFNGASFSSLACTDCHSAAGLQAPFLSNWTEVNSYGAANTSDFGCGTVSGAAISGFNYMAKRVACGEMPSGDDLTVAGKGLFASWASGGFLRWAAPTVSTSAASAIQKYSVLLNGTINENGSDANTAIVGRGAFFRYATSAATVDAGAGTESSKVNPAGTGGGSNATAYSRTISGLNCGSRYYFRAWGTNAIGSGSGSRLSVDTLACPTISEGASVNVVMSEDGAPTPFNLTLNANENVSWSISSAAANGTASASGSGTSKVIGYTPNANFSGADSFVVQISDGTSTDSIIVNVTVNAVNDAPLISQGASTVVAMSEDGTPTPFALILNASDNDSATLTWSIATPASNGSATASGTGTAKTIGYTPAANFNGSDSFVVQVSDGLLSDTILVTVNVAASNDAPLIAGPDPVPVAMSEDGAPSAFSLLLNASDVDLDVLSWSISGVAGNGLASASGTGAAKAVSYVPNADFNGADSFVVQVSDGLLTDSVTVNVSVAAVNDAPLISSIAPTSATEAVPYSYNATANDPDDANNGSDLQWSLTAAPAGMTVSSSGLVEWTPPNGVSSANVTLRLADGGEDGAAAATQSWTITVDGVNDPPLITSTAPGIATEDTPYSYVVQVSDPDDANNGADLLWQLSNAPAGMVVSNTGVISWTPTEGVLSSGTVTVTVSDGGENGSTPASEVFSVAVTAVNDAPQITSSAPVSASEDTLYQYAVAVSDVDDANNGSELSWSLSNAPAGMTISSTGLISWTPGEGVLASGSVTVRVADGGEDGALPASQNFSVTVTPVNDAPQLTSVPAASATEEQPYSYQVTVSDPDDLNNGSDISFTLLAAPAGMTVSSTGLLGWTPGEGVTSSGLIRLQIADGLEDGVQPLLQQWTVTVVAVNDAPTLAPLANQSVSELSTFTLPVQVIDPDDANDGSNLQWTLLNGPAGLTLSSVGVLDWTPGQASAGVYPISVQVADGGEDGATPGSLAFTLTVTLLDDDGDSIADYIDNCPATANSDQADLDADDQGDACDDDIDGDGIPNAVEQTYGLDPRDPADAAGDLDSDGLTNLAEFNSCAEVADPVISCAALAVDSVPPVITVADLILPQTGYLTEVALLGSASDGLEGSVPLMVVTINGDSVSLPAGSSESLRPGRYDIDWRAEDSAGNVALLSQRVDILPQASLGETRVLRRGESLPLRLLLGGLAPTYPLTVNYVLSGDAVAGSDFSLAPDNGRFVLAGGTATEVVITGARSGAPQPDRILRLTLADIDGDAISGEAVTTEVLISDVPSAPEVTLAAQQNGLPGRLFYADQGPIEVRVEIRDNPGDTHTLDWTDSDMALALSGNTSVQQIDPAGLPAGVYRVAVTVSDGVNLVTQQLAWRLTATAPQLDALNDSDGDGIDDLSEGFADSDNDGLADYLDAIDAAALQPLRAGSATSTVRFAAAVPAGLTLVPGSDALAAATGGVSVSSTRLPVDPDYAVIGSLYDFEIHGLNAARRQAELIVPLPQPLPPQARWRKYQQGQWQNFVENGSDSLASTRSSDGRCPAFADSRWRAGLRAGDDCVRLRLTDGGANDADGEANGVIRDPSGAALARTPPAPPAVPTSGPNSGALFYGWLLLLAVGCRQRGIR